MPKLQASGAFGRALDDNADALNGAYWKIYAAGTTTQATTYSNALLTIANAWPVIGDAAGRLPDIYVAPGNYRIRVETAGGALIAESDNNVVYGLDPGEVAVAKFATVPIMIADETMGYALGGSVSVVVAAGDIVESGGFRLTVLASGAAQPDATNASGVKLRVNPNASGRYPLAANGFSPAATAAQNLARWDAFIAARSAGDTIELSGGVHDVAGGLVVDKALHFHVAADTTLRLTSSALFVMRHLTDMTVTGDGTLTLDGNGQDPRHGLTTATALPKLYSPVTVTNVRNGFTTATDPAVGLNDEVGTGRGIYTRAKADNCSSIGFFLGGTGDYSATLEMIECETTTTVGSGTFEGGGAGDGRVLNNRRFGKVIFRGGTYRGAATAKPTHALRCLSAEIIGGLYEGIDRGPTLGIATVDYTIVGTICQNLANIGISADTTLETPGPETVARGVIANNIITNCGRAIRTTGSDIAITGNTCSDNTSADGVIVVAGAGQNVLIDGNVILNRASPDFIAIRATDNSNPRIGVNHTNATRVTNVFAASGSKNTFQRVISVSADYDLNMFDEVIQVNAASNDVDFRLPENTSQTSEGKTFTFIITNGTNAVRFLRRNAEGLINGTTGYTVAAGATAFTMVRAVSLSDGTWAVTKSAP